MAKKRTKKERGRTGSCELVFKADIKGSVGKRSERHALLFPRDIFGSAILITDGILDLQSTSAMSARTPVASGISFCGRDRMSPVRTHMHVKHLPITLLPIDYCSRNHKRVSSDKIPDAAFIFGAMTCMCCEIKL